ncbi:MAG TPA: hypothetical protein VLL52_23400 [Anaerolineae bacterium]|nr:hypothetical protein [Anaerolineae bacterium]
MTFQQDIERFQKKYFFAKNDDRIKFLMTLCFYISMFARGTYPEIRQNKPDCANDLISFNELTHRVSKQSLAILLEDSDMGYPHDTFLTDLAQTDSDLVKADFIQAISKASRYL